MLQHIEIYGISDVYTEQVVGLMGIEKLIEWANEMITERAIQHSGDVKIAESILIMIDCYEALLKSERSKVIAEVREWALNDGQQLRPWTVYRGGMLAKLDSMEKEDGK